MAAVIVSKLVTKENVLCAILRDKIFLLFCHFNFYVAKCDKTANFGPQIPFEYALTIESSTNIVGVSLFHEQG